MQMNNLCDRVPVSELRGWKLLAEAQLAPFQLHERCAFPFLETPLPAVEEAVLGSFRHYGAAPQHEYLYHYRKPALIEPTMGYVLADQATIIPESMPHYWDCGLPDQASVARELNTRPVIGEPAVISLREFGDNNYYHFYSDVLGKLALLNEHGIGAEVPIVVSARLAQQPYFLALLHLINLHTRRWIVQDDAVIAADEVFFCKPMPHARRSFDFVLDQMRLWQANRQARIFLTRQSGRGRWIENRDEMESVCRAAGFTIVDADTLALREQIAVFRSARFVVGIHGAGLVNCMFRRGDPLDLLELFPPENIPPHYFWLAHTYNFGYDALVGQAATQAGAFRVDPALLRAKLERLIARRPEY